jgi:hypothetical protein
MKLRSCSTTIGQNIDILESKYCVSLHAGGYDVIHAHLLLRIARSNVSKITVVTVPVDAPLCMFLRASESIHRTKLF